MATASEQFKLIRLQQPATAVNKDLRVTVGWRPAMAWVMNYKAAGRMAIAVDGEAVTGGLFLPTDSAASGAVGADGITFHDEGVVLGKDTALVRDNAGEIIVMLFRNMQSVAQIALADAPATVSSFGTGRQFGAGDTSRNDAGETAAENAVSGIGEVTVTTE